MKPVCMNLTVLDMVPFGQTGREPAYFALRLDCPNWLEWHPGQFVMLRPESFMSDHILARPFSICHVTKDHLVCFFQVCGNGTKMLSRAKSGDKISVWGPLGTWFKMEEKTPTLLLAGGMGIAPFVGYVNHHPNLNNLEMIFGHRDDIGCYPAESINGHIPFESMQESKKGDLDKFIEVLEHKIETYAKKNGLVLACGPNPFLRTVQKLAAKNNVCCQISLENRMACGVGACLGCVCTTSRQWPEKNKKNWPVQVCLKGPVFFSNLIEL